MGSEYSAALGPKWAHYINTRLSLVYRGEEGLGALQVVKSPFAPEMTLAFQSTQGGVREVDAGGVRLLGRELEPHISSLQYLW